MFSEPSNFGAGLTDRQKRLLKAALKAAPKAGDLFPLLEVGRRAGFGDDINDVAYSLYEFIDIDRNLTFDSSGKPVLVRIEKGVAVNNQRGPVASLNLDARELARQLNLDSRKKRRAIFFGILKWAWGIAVTVSIALVIHYFEGKTDRLEQLIRMPTTQK